MHNSTCPSPKPILFASKADTLLGLTPYEDLNIPPCYVFDVMTWNANSQGVLDGVMGQFPGDRLAVRSSCANEDTADGSGAGAFTSRLFVDGSDKASLGDAIEAVIASYPAGNSADQILVQPMRQNVVISGVIMTRSSADGSPYYVINYDDSGQVDSITGGREASKTVYIFRNAKESDCDSATLRRLIVFSRRVEALCSLDSLDIEFCIDASGVLSLLQVRPICTQTQWINNTDQHVEENIDYVVSFLSERMAEWPNLVGKRTILGVMPDWNPAEMIGITPRRLASSLYRELITRDVWRHARGQMGYRQMPPEELMVFMAGRPYIDVRVSLNSFLPQGLDRITESALVNAWLERLDSQPQLHDKVEFEVAQTALDFCFDNHLDERYPGLLTQARREEFRSALRLLTLRCLLPDRHSTLQWAFESITELRNRQSIRPLVAHNFLRQERKPIPQMILLSEECRQLGTLPFSILARHAFIAEALLRTAVKRGALSATRLTAFRKSVKTISSQMSHDILDVCRNDMDKDVFLQRYGHLRPSSYDILSPRYMERKGLFSESAAISITEHAAQDFFFTAEERNAVETLLREAGLEAISTDRLLEYARTSIAGRELAKFVFTRNLSDILELLAAWGDRLGFEREELSHLDIRDVMEWTTHALLRNAHDYFQELVAEGRELFDLGRSIKLGYLIRSPRDVFVVPQHRSAPNFVGHDKAEAPVTRLYADSPCTQDIHGHVVCVENADPGFDWVFTRGIAGLVTLFGGVNSHMAIRCAEYGLPAAIGVGERLFEIVANAQRCLLNADACVLQAL